MKRNILFFIYLIVGSALAETYEVSYIPFEAHYFTGTVASNFDSRSWGTRNMESQNLEKLFKDIPSKCKLSPANPFDFRVKVKNNSGIILYVDTELFFAHNFKECAFDKEIAITAINEIKLRFKDINRMKVKDHLDKKSSK